MARTQVFEWFSKFKSGVTSGEDAECLEHSSTSKTDENVALVMELFLENRRTTIHQVANLLEISLGSAESILKDNLNFVVFLPHSCITS
jgi:hypothetical protein